MAFWSVIHAPVPLASLGHLLEMKNLSPLLRPTELKSMRTYSHVTHMHIKVWEALVNAIGYLSSYITINLQLEWLQTIQSVTQMCRQGRKLFPCIGFSSLHLSSDTFTVGGWLQQFVLSYPDMLLSLDFVRTVSCLELFYSNSAAASLECQSYIYAPFFLWFYVPF